MLSTLRRIGARWVYAGIVVGLVIVGLTPVLCNHIKRRAIRPQTAPASGDGITPSAVAGIQLTQPLDVLSIDVTKSQWPTEVLSEQLDGQLVALANLLSATDPVAAESLRPIASEDAQTIHLVPIHTHVCYTNGNLRVERAHEQLSAESAGQVSGIDQLAVALTHTVRPFENVSNVHVKFKIVGIATSNETASTSLLVSITGRAGDLQWQQNAVWNCDWRTTTVPPLLTRLEGLPGSFERVVSRRDQTIFSDQTAAMIGKNPCFDGQLRQEINYWLSRLESAHGIDLVAAHGVSVADVNGDGLDDVYVCQPGGLPNRLFIASSNGRTTEQAARFGLDICDATRSALFIDVDNDGDQDLAIIVVDQLVLFEHTATGEFLLRHQIPIRVNPIATLAADFDSDGLLDLYVLNHDSDVASTATNGILGTPIPFHDANNGGANAFFRNLGNFVFQEVTAEVGLDSNNSRFSLAGSWEDYDNDGDLDLYVANDFGRNNVYRNDRGRFVDVAGQLHLEDLSAGMSVSWGDVDNDGRQDLYISNMFSSAGNRIAYQRSFHATDSVETRRDFQRHARGNSLFRQIADGEFQDVSEAWNVTMGRWAWASKLADVNNDGLLDILITNGFVTNENTADL